MWWIIFLSCVTLGNTLRLVAYISSGGLHGEIYFEQTIEESVRIRFALEATLQYPTQQWLWSVTKFPVDYTTIEGRCDDQQMGESVIDLTELMGPLEISGNETSSIEVPGISLTGEKGLWGKGLVLKETSSPRTICASITVTDKKIEKFAEARFYGPVAGSIWFRSLGGQAGDNTTDTIIYTNLFHVHKDKKLQSLDFTEHHWKIYVTDIVEVEKVRRFRDKSNCNYLEGLYDPDNSGAGRSIGDVDSRLGKIKVAVDPNRRFKSSYRDPELHLLPANDLGPHRLLYLVIFHPKHDDSFLACAKISHQKPVFIKTLINSRGIRGDVTLSRSSPFDPTWVNISLVPTNDLETRLRYATKVASYEIHELPPEPPKTVNDPKDPCTTTKKIYNPSNIDIKTVPPPGLGTQDQYAIGDLSGKLQGRREGYNHIDILNGSSKLSGIYWDLYLPLSGAHSVVHRSLVIYKHNETDNKSIIPWTCGTLITHRTKGVGQIPLFTAEVVFRYPIVGRIIFRQPKDDPAMDTTIIIENLIHSDGSASNNSAEHRWIIHEKPPGKDYYNWTGRCLSAGNPYNPYNIDSDQPERCTANEVSLCRLGDLTRHGTLEIAGRKIYGPLLTRKLFTDSRLPLTGPYSILGKSLVIYDDHGPVARGERLACSIIRGVYRRKAIAKDWLANGEDISLKGKVEFIQQSEYDVTDVEVNLDGLQGKMSGYHVHMTPVEIDLVFPCESTTLYGHWNPLNISTEHLPATTEGTADQYELGDLSGKFGTLDNRKRYMTGYNDTMLPLFGPRSILGRSIVIHKKEKNIRWACSTIERGYAPSEARELRAIASFHHPDGFAYGYIRMTQLVYSDGSQSETIIEVKLRHPGVQNRNITRNHNWAIYVNPVGVDAAVKIKDTRCVAGGYIWNPYFTQLADPLNDELYRQECGPDLPLRCHVGDISARLGPIDIGSERQVFTDPNFPLEGSVSAMGKSIVILDKDFGNHRFACANIEPDNDIIKYANIQKPPRFVAAEFLEDIRTVMGVPPWMLSIDSRKTRVLEDGLCIQFLLHFKGPIASKLEQDFNRLLTIGRLEAPSLYIPGFISRKRKSTSGHRLCKNVLRSGSSLPVPNLFFTFLSGYFITKITWLVSL